jgi:hypothetical protein
MVKDALSVTNLSLAFPSSKRVDNAPSPRTPLNTPEQSVKNGGQDPRVTLDRALYIALNSASSFWQMNMIKPYFMLIKKHFEVLVDAFPPSTPPSVAC